MPKLKFDFFPVCGTSGEQGSSTMECGNFFIYFYPFFFLDDLLLMACEFGDSADPTP